MEQTAKITCDGFDTFYFDHNFETGYQHALKQYEKLKNSVKYKSIQLFVRNRRNVGPIWLKEKEG